MYAPVRSGRRSGRHESDPGLAPYMSGDWRRDVSRGSQNLPGLWRSCTAWGTSGVRSAGSHRTSRSIRSATSIAATVDTHRVYQAPITGLLSAPIPEIRTVTRSPAFSGPVPPVNRLSCRPSRVGLSMRRSWG